MTAQHTPTPWSLLEPKRGGGEFGSLTDRGIVADGAVIGEMWTDCPKPNGAKHIADASENAAFAIRAVNGHASLVEALAELLALVESDATFENRDLEPYKYEAIVDDVKRRAANALAAAKAGAP